MSSILIYNNGQKVAMTSKASNIFVKDELMRERTLNFTLTNLDNARKYAIDSSATYEVDGQKYDLETYNQNSGADNVTQFTAVHILTHTSRYRIPAKYNYGNVSGTLQDVIADMLSTSGGDAEFTVGECTNIPVTTLSLNNDQEISLLTALYKLCPLGCEIDFDNFTIKAPIRIGSNTGKVFKFGRDLINLDRKFDRTTTPWTYSYTISIANLQRVHEMVPTSGTYSTLSALRAAYPTGAEGLYRVIMEDKRFCWDGSAWAVDGYPNDKFQKGDTISIEDVTIGDSVTDKRIISYDKCGDDPTKDTVTIGQFVPDISDTLTHMKANISATTAVANNSVHVGESYNGVDISHEYGFKSESGNGLYREFSNGTDGFVIQRKYGGSWVVVWQAETYTGKTVAYNLAHTQKVEMGGDYGLRMFKSTNGGQTWTFTGGMDSQANLVASQLRNVGSGTYGIVGTTTQGYAGLQLIYDDGKTFFNAVRLTDGGFAFENDGRRVVNASPDATDLHYDNASGTVNTGVQCDANGILLYKNGMGIGHYGDIYIGNTKITFENGMAKSFVNSNAYSGTIIENGYVKTYVRGVLITIVPQ